MIVELKSDLITQYLQINNEILAVFGSSYCKYCVGLKPELEQLAKEYPEREIILIDCDKFPLSADLYNIESYPTIIYFRNQQPIRTKVTNNINKIRKMWS